MRRIEYRAWDTQENKWYAPIFEAYKGQLHELLISFAGELSERTLEGNRHESCFPKRYILSESTGLLDKDDNKIFNGDIMEFTVFDYNDHDTQYIGKVSYEGGKYYLETKTAYFDLDWVLCQDCTAKVVGNIFENPDVFEKGCNHDWVLYDMENGGARSLEICRKCPAVKNTKHAKIQTKKG